MKAKSLKTISDYRNMFLAANFPYIHDPTQEAILVFSSVH